MGKKVAPAIEPDEEEERVQLADAQKKELAALVEENDGTITPAQIVAFAADPKTALHSRFTWDNGEAARKWREREAGQLLRFTMTVLPGPKGAVRFRQFASLPSDRGTGVYRPIEAVLGNAAWKKELEEQYRADMLRAQARHAVLGKVTKGGIYQRVEEALRG